MSTPRIISISTAVATLAGAIFIAIAAPGTGVVAVAEDGGSSQNPPPPTPDGHPWGG
jgi:hypothetical protein